MKNINHIEHVHSLVVSPGQQTLFQGCHSGLKLCSGGTAGATPWDEKYDMNCRAGEIEIQQKHEKHCIKLLCIIVTSETSSDYPGIRWRLQSEHVQLCNKTSQATGEPKHSPRPEAGDPGGVVKDGCWLFQTCRP